MESNPMNRPNFDQMTEQERQQFGNFVNRRLRKLWKKRARAKREAEREAEEC